MAMLSLEGGCVLEFRAAKRERLSLGKTAGSARGWPASSSRRGRRAWAGKLPGMRRRVQDPFLVYRLWHHESPVRYAALCMERSDKEAPAQLQLFPASQTDVWRDEGGGDGGDTWLLAVTGAVMEKGQMQDLPDSEWLIRVGNDEELAKRCHRALWSCIHRLGRLDEMDRAGGGVRSYIDPTKGQTRSSYASSGPSTPCTLSTKPTPSRASSCSSFASPENATSLRAPVDLPGVQKLFRLHEELEAQISLGTAPRHTEVPLAQSIPCMPPPPVPKSEVPEALERLWKTVDARFNAMLADLEPFSYPPGLRHPHVQVSSLSPAGSADTTASTQYASPLLAAL